MKKINLMLAAVLSSLTLWGNTVVLSPHDIVSSFDTTATIQPRNRLEILPPVSGRLESMEVSEGQIVKQGDFLATMSSTDRATLLDAARGNGSEELAYWQDIYKPIQLVAPMDGTVIVATLKPGQGVTTADPIVVLSDELIAQATADEIDIGKIQKGQSVSVTLDAFPGKPLKASVEHIYYESITDSNVTVYPINIALERVPEFVRSGMNAQCRFETVLARNVAALPRKVVNIVDEQNATVVVQDAHGKESVRAIKVGKQGDDWVEIVDGLGSNEKVLASEEALRLQIQESGSNPFMPQFGRRKK